MAQSLLFFLLAGLAEIGGGYLMWLWLRDGRPLWLGVLGALVLMLYGVLPTLQPASFDFSRTYAAYGGLFIVLSVLWGKVVDGQQPDTATLLGAFVALVGAGIMAYWPR